MKRFLRKLSAGLLRFCLSNIKSSDFVYSKVFLIAPHPDDEVFGLGGLISKLVDDNVELHILYLTDGEGSGVYSDKERIREERIKLSMSACDEIKIPASNVYRLHIADSAVPNSMSTDFKKTVKTVSVIIDNIRPDVVFATHVYDQWPYDHVACAEIAKMAVNESQTKPQLWYYWVWAWYNLRPWHLSLRQYKNLTKIDISDKLTDKKRLADIYMNSYTPDGRPLIGVLPDQLIRSFHFPFEIIEQIL